MTPDNLREMLASAALHASIPDGPALAVLIASTNWFRIRHENPDDIDGARMLFSAVGLAAADAALAALRDAGLAVVPKVTTFDMKLAATDAMIVLVEADNAKCPQETDFQRGMASGAAMSCGSKYLDAAYRAMLSAGDLLGKPDADPR